MTHQMKLDSDPLAPPLSYPYPSLALFALKTDIVVLLFLVIYIFAIMACLLFGLNDTARFGTVPQAM